MDKFDGNISEATLKAVLADLGLTLDTGTDIRGEFWYVLRAPEFIWLGQTANEALKTVAGQLYR